MKQNLYFTNGYSDVIMGTMVSQNQSHDRLSIVYSGADQRKHQSSASLAFVPGINRWPANYPHKWPVKQKMFPFDDVIMIQLKLSSTRDPPFSLRVNVKNVLYKLIFWKKERVPSSNADDFEDDILFCATIFMQISAKFVPSGTISNKSALVH